MGSPFFFGVVAACVIGAAMGHGPAAAFAGAVDMVVARVNGEIITESDWRKSLRDQGAGSATPEAVGHMLDRTLLLQEAKRQKIDIPDEALAAQVEETVRALRAKYPTEKLFMESLAAEGLTLEKLKSELLKRTKTDFQVFQAVTAGAAVTEEDVARFEESRRAEGRSATSLRLRRLGVAIKKKGGAAEACERARELIQKINTEGLSFEDGVRQYSAVPGAKEDGGDLGWMETTKLSAQVVEATADLKPGQASVPIVAGGYANIFYVEGKRGGKAHLMEERFTQQRTKLLERLREQAQVEIYSDKMARVLPKEYSSRVRVVRRGTEQARSVTTAPVKASAGEGTLPGAELQPVSAPAEATPAPAPRKGLLRMFRRQN